MVLTALIFVALMSSAAQANSAADESPQNRLTEALELENRGDLEGAERILHEIAEMAETSQPRGIVLPAILCQLGSLEQGQTHYGEAERLYKRSIALWRSLPRQPRIGLAQALNDLGSLYLETGRKTLAESLCRESLQIRVQLEGPNHPDVALEYSNLAVTAYQRKKYRNAESWAWKAIHIWEQLDANKNQSDFAYNTLALVYSAQSQNQKALTAATRAIEVEGRKSPPDFPLLAGDLQTLARVYMRIGRWEDAETKLHEALDIVESSPEISNLEKYGILADNAVVLRKTGRKAAAQELEKQITAWREEVIRTNGLGFSIDVNALRK